LNPPVAPLDAGDRARESGVVAAAYRRHFDVALDGGEHLECLMKGRSLQIACGDRVEVARVAGGGAIESIAPRSTLIYRSDAYREKLIAANATQIVGVVAVGLALDLELVHRWMIAAEAEGCRFIVAANKRDLPEFATLRDRLAPVAALGYPIVELSARDDVGPLKPWLAGQRSVLIGQSGMGKSTIINALSGRPVARTEEVSVALHAGRHTTSSTTLYPLPAFHDTWIVDSPGMKAFGLAHIAPEAIERAFVELRPLLGHCRFRDCRHDREPGCAVQEAVARGAIEPFRIALMHTLLRASTVARKSGP
jgi:ribosome biogenesis GTPase / thiamine phosphate phosphatase